MSDAILPSFQWNISCGQKLPNPSNSGIFNGLSFIVIGIPYKNVMH